MFSSEFMLSLHKRLHQLHQSQQRTVRQSVDGLPVFQYTPASEHHPMEVVADELAQDVHVLCLDEMQVRGLREGEGGALASARARTQVCASAVERCTSCMHLHTPAYIYTHTHMYIKQS